jgi:hypothetical protein
MVSKEISPEELIKILAMERLSGEGNTEIISGELPHGVSSWCIYLVGDDDWEESPDGGRRVYTWDNSHIGDKIIFWTGRNRRNVFRITAISGNHLGLNEKIFNPRKGDKYTIFREANHGSTG